MNETTATTPVGIWLELFSVLGEPKSSTLLFTPKGRAFILAGPSNGGSGSGTWEATGENTFSYRLAERMIDVESGSYIGWVDIDHHAVQDGEMFTSTGISRVYDANDDLVTTVHVDARGTRQERITGAVEVVL